MSLYSSPSMPSTQTNERLSCMSLNTPPPYYDAMPNTPPPSLNTPPESLNKISQLTNTLSASIIDMQLKYATQNESVETMFEMAIAILKRCKADLVEKNEAKFIAYKVKCDIEYRKFSAKYEDQLTKKNILIAQMKDKIHQMSQFKVDQSCLI